MARPPRVSADLYSSGMVRRFGWLYYATGLFLFLRRIRITDDAAERVRLAAIKGPIVYSLRTRSILDYIALNQALQLRRLPLASFGTGVRVTAFRPLWESLDIWRRRIGRFLRQGRLPHPVTSGWLQEHVGTGHNVAVFLKQPSTWREIFSAPDWPDPVGAVVEAQKERPDSGIQVLPVVVIWQRTPEPARTPTMQVLLGTEEDPSPLTKLAELIWRAREPLVQVGEPVDVREYLERVGEQPPRIQAKGLRLLVRRYCYREAQVVRGARQKSHRWMRRLVLRSSRMRRLVEAEAEATGRKPESIQRQLVQMYDRLAAKFSYPVLVVFRGALHIILNSVYRGVDMRPEDIERVRAASRDGVCVLVPCHRSHVDYLLLSKMLWDADIVPPHIVAGDNLSFFPVGTLFRRGGAMFIRRKFDDRLFPGLFRAYLTQLFREGHSVEFFIEGGRSRTGKLLPPKLGILGFTVDAGVEARVGRSLDEVSWLPVSITYEQIAEENPYARELSGEAKKSESLREVAKASRVIFKRFGRVHLRVAEPLKLSGFLSELDGPWEELNKDQRREALQGLGERILHGINTVSVTPPSSLLSMGLLAQSDSDVGVTVLEERIRCYEALLGSGEEPRVDAADRRRKALSRLLRDGLVARVERPQRTFYRVNPERRITLEYYKNSALHRCIEASMLATVIRSQGTEGASAGAFRADFRFLLYLLRYEFVHDPDADEWELEARGLAQLEAAGVVARLADGTCTVLDESGLASIAGLLSNFLESYYVVLRALEQLRSRDVPEKGLAKEIQKVGQQLLAVGDIHRPESLSLVNLQNALKAFREDAIFSPRSDGGLEISAAGHGEFLSALRRLGDFQA